MFTDDDVAFELLRLLVSDVQAEHIPVDEPGQHGCVPDDGVLLPVLVVPAYELLPGSGERERRCQMRQDYPDPQVRQVSCITLKEFSDSVSHGIPSVYVLFGK